VNLKSLQTLRQQWYARRPIRAIIKSLNQQPALSSSIINSALNTPVPLSDIQTTLFFKSSPQQQQQQQSSSSSTTTTTTSSKKTILSAGNLEAQSERNKDTALSAAAQAGKYGCCEILLTKGQANKVGFVGRLVWFG